jgi:4-methyl-5(b-hydroxyethyl)-thiazole monophosphate biosynthesis
MARVLVPLAQGCEELEAVTIIDLLRRAGVEVITAGLDDKPVKASRGVTLIPDTTLDKVINQEFNMIALPGGLPGADHLDRDLRIQKLVKQMAADKKFTVAICAAPKVLATAGLLDGKHATSFPGILEKLQLDNTTLETDAVVQDGKVITSRGPGTAIDFSLALIENLVGSEKRKEVESGLQRH